MRTIEPGGERRGEARGALVGEVGYAPGQHPGA